MALPFFLWTTFQKFRAQINNQWHETYITPVSKTPYFFIDDDHGWRLGYTADISFLGYQFPANVGTSIDPNSENMKLKTNITTPIDLQNTGIEYQLYLNPAYKEMLLYDIKYVRVFYETEDNFTDYDISTTRDFTNPDMLPFVHFLNQQFFF